MWEDKLFTYLFSSLFRASLHHIHDWYSELLTVHWTSADPVSPILNNFLMGQIFLLLLKHSYLYLQVPLYINQLFSKLRVLEGGNFLSFFPFFLLLLAKFTIETSKISSQILQLYKTRNLFISCLISIRGKVHTHDTHCPHIMRHLVFPLTLLYKEPAGHTGATISILLYFSHSRNVAFCFFERLSQSHISEYAHMLQANLGGFSKKYFHFSHLLKIVLYRKSED